MTIRTTDIILSCLLASAATHLMAVDKIRLQPPSLKLVGQEARHQILAELYSDAEAVGPAAVQLTTDNPGVVRIDGMTVHSVANGQAIVRVVGRNRRFGFRAGDGLRRGATISMVISKPCRTGPCKTRLQFRCVSWCISGQRWLQAVAKRL